MRAATRCFGAQLGLLTPFKRAGEMPLDIGRFLDAQVAVQEVKNLIICNSARVAFENLAMLLYCPFTSALSA